MPQTDHPVWNPHATLASKQTKEEIRIIWNYVSSLPKPDFIMPFNNVCIFRLNEQKVWVVEKKYNLI
jgi:2'-5' RNA ligase